MNCRFMNKNDRFFEREPTKSIPMYVGVNYGMLAYKIIFIYWSIKYAATKNTNLTQRAMGAIN